MAFPGKVTIYNLTLTLANTEYSQTLPEGTFKFTLKCRTSADVKLAFTSGESGSNYLTVSGGQSYWDDNIHTSLTLYLQSTTAGAIVEIVAWTGA